MPVCLVFKGAHHLTPTHSGDRLRKRRVTDQTLDRQTLNGDPWVFVNKPRGEFVGAVAATIRHLGVETGLDAILRSFLGLGEPLLR